MNSSFCSFLGWSAPHSLTPSLLPVCERLLLKLRACWQVSNLCGALCSEFYSLRLFQQLQRSLAERLSSVPLFYQGSLQLFRRHPTSSECYFDNASYVATVTIP